MQVRASLEHQAQTDSLTGLYNHRFFHERLRAELTRAARAHDSVGLLMFDIDDFKRVNDICGHAVGDQILVAIAGALTSLVRASDIACRVGGEEFAVIMPSCGAGDALGLRAAADRAAPAAADRRRRRGDVLRRRSPKAPRTRPIRASSWPARRPR